MIISKRKIQNFTMSDVSTSNKKNHKKRQNLYSIKHIFMTAHIHSFGYRHFKSNVAGLSNAMGE